MLMRMRYVTKRINRAGKERWYWQRPGHKLTRLPDDPASRFAEQARLNALADGRRQAENSPGTIGWIVETYKASDRYQELKPGTRSYYNRFLGDIERLGSALPFALFDRKKVVDFIHAYPKRHQRRQVAAVLKNLVGEALYHGYLETDPTERLRLQSIAPRERLWSDAEVTCWRGSAVTEDPHMLTAFLLLQYTAQRPGDVLVMTWAQYNSQTIRLRQQKTRTLVEVPCHPTLKAHLDGLTRTGMMIVAYRNRAVPYLRFNERFRRIAKRAGIDAQARDLRRTAMVRMAEAGASVPEIAAVSGHTIDRTARILETYLPRTLKLAEGAITKLAEHKPGSKV
jgi:integrase